MRILISGGAGCLGSNLVDHWLELGHDLCVIDNYATGTREALPQSPSLTVHEASIADAARVNVVFAAFKPEVVVHAAAAYKDPDDWEEDARTNVLGSIHLARAARTYGACRLINFQTTLCYGRPRRLPIPVDHPLAPFGSYAISKTAAESYMLLCGLPTVSLRLASITGPRLCIGPIPTFYKRLKAGQPCYCSATARDFLDMADFLDFMDIAIRHDAPTGTFNLGSGVAHTMKEVFDLVAGHLGLQQVDVPVIPAAQDDVEIVALDASVTRRAFDWHPRVNFEEAISRQLVWYDAHGVTAAYSHLKPAGFRQ